MYLLGPLRDELRGRCCLVRACCAGSAFAVLPPGSSSLSDRSSVNVSVLEDATDMMEVPLWWEEGRRGGEQEDKERLEEGKRA